VGDRADWILTDAVVWEGGPGSGPPPSARRAPADPSPRPDAMALRDGKVLAVGREEDILNLRGPHTALFPMEGRFVMPGFVDAHVHLLVGGLQLFRVDLRGVGTRQEFVQRVGDRTRSTPPGEWILGGGWNQEDWGGGLPDREWLDRVTPEHPVFLERMDLHMALANTRALELAGIDEETPDPPNGSFDRDPETGRLTGLIREKAMLAMTRAIPPLTDEARRSAIRAAALTALSRGITQVHDMGAVQRASESWESLAVVRALDKEGRLPLRVGSALPVADWEHAAELVAREGRGEGRVRWGRVKGFVDGSFGSSTAWFGNPYLHLADNHCGAEICDLGRLRDDLRWAVGAGLQPAVHAIGDRANEWLLEVRNELAALHPEEIDRFRFEHAQHLTGDLVREMGRSGVVASVQPLHMIDDAPHVGEKLGPERERFTYAFGSMARAGVRLALGSDWPVAPMDPISTAWIAATRSASVEGWPGDPAWLPAERLSLDAALRAHTWGSAVAGCAEETTGSLESGKLADFVVLSADPFAVPLDELWERIQVEMTFVDGVMAYRRDDAAAALAG
jgi:predicted amidohydrolase YtcJ